MKAKFNRWFNVPAGEWEALARRARGAEESGEESDAGVLVGEEGEEELTVRTFSHDEAGGC
jgi:hypothetical protein